MDIQSASNNMLVKLDELEDKIAYANSIIEQYDDLKKKIKKEMVDFCNETGAEQVKWTTPNGSKITLTKGHIAEIEKETQKFFDEQKLKAFYPDVYESCMVEKEVSVVKKNATSDTLRITLGGK